MNVEISKSELAGALAALGKLVCRTSPVEIYRSLRIEGKNNQISFQTAGVNEAITFTLPAEGVEVFAVVVNFDEFRTIVRASRNKTLVLEYGEGKFGVDLLDKVGNFVFDGVPEVDAFGFTFRKKDFTDFMACLRA